ncbi:DUF484 family protein [Ketobacter sp. MCCC 1A13808]|uniref:DUF484 family protein n=1 Tax=Ketobacter sp. MCCC 1A13808 TaxID=2602738 RepID=UPI000F13EB68|nr:DUF484 family protein [Ketobacter sp. MCCC 1A13808]MVF14041.1 DUF484 family protein [Ketobacter sp. MCCC 1A13808]RLP55071.1 MAG: DUF484 family protein [Ketobacter sp.]
MTESTAERQQQEIELTAADVANYLRSHSDFFVNRPDILYDMELPHAPANAASLLERQASVLRSRNTELRHKLNELVGIARDNDKLFGQIKNLGLSLLEANSLNELGANLKQVLALEFELEHANLFVYKSAATPATHITLSSPRDLQVSLRDLLRGNRIICTTLRKTEMSFLFPGYSQSEGSAILIPLHYNQDLGLLAIGSTDPGHFNSNMDTAFARYIGDILSRRLLHLLA